jgi:hypothetical protein
VIVAKIKKAVRKLAKALAPPRVLADYTWELAAGEERLVPSSIPSAGRKGEIDPPVAGVTLLGFVREPGDYARIRNDGPAVTCRIRIVEGEK